MLRILFRNEIKDVGEIMSDTGLIAFLIHDALLLLAVVNPIGNIPIYDDLTKEMQKDKRRQIINTAVVTSFCIVVVFALIGDWALKNLFEVTIEEFKIAGGILLFIVAVRGVMSGVSSYTSSSKDYRTLAIFPLAFPIIVGPGTLAVTIILAQHRGPIQMVSISLITFLIVLLIARNANFLTRLSGRYGAMIIPRLLYLFLASKAIALVLEGTLTFLKQNLYAIPTK